MHHSVNSSISFILTWPWRLMAYHIYGMLVTLFWHIFIFIIMERKESSRHLAAILFTDIVGYTSMMQRDEHLALTKVRRHQEVLEKMIPAHQGEIYQYYGDGCMSIFSSATQAVQCAYEIQKELLRDPVVHIRTGIHIGEIYTEGGKVFGDGVNIASRIESIGQGGAVLFSRDVYEKVRNHTAFQIQSIGKFEFKNVEDAIEVFALTNPEVITPDMMAIEGKLRTRSNKKKIPLQIILMGVILVLVAGYFLALRPANQSASHAASAENKSIAVLPFKNLSGDGGDDFMSIGIAEDILTQLAQIQGLKVISRSSSLRFKDSDQPVTNIARELGVNNILEGSIRTYDNDLRVSVRLINGMNGTLIWAADFDRQIEDVLNVQKDVALAVSANLKIALSPGLKNRLQGKTNVNPEAYINYQKGRELLSRSSGTKADMESAIQHFETAIKKDSTFSKAWVGLGDAYLESVFWHRMETHKALPKARHAAIKALELDPALGEGHSLLGAIGYYERDFTESEKHLRKAMEYNPNHSLAYDRLGWILIMRGQAEEAFRLLYKTIELDPLSTRNKGSLGNAHALLGRYEEGIALMESYLEPDPTDNYLLWTLGFLQALNGQCDKAIESLNRRSIGKSTNWVLTYCYAKTGDRKSAEAILQTNIEKSKTQLVPDFMLAVQFNALGYTDEALDHLKRSINQGEENFFVISLERDPMFENLWSHPEYQKLIKQVKREFGLVSRN